MKHAFIVSACKKYVPELCALLNSLDFIGNTHPVHVIGYELPKDFTAQFDKLGFDVVLYDVPETEARQYAGEAEILCRKRYWYAAEWASEYGYDSVCVLDADMVFVRPVDHFFEIAARCDLILGASLEQKRVYGGIEHHKIRGHQMLNPPQWNPKDICCAPMFVNMKRYGELFRDSWRIFADGWPDTNFKAPDMESYNLLLLVEGLIDRVLLLPNYSFVGTNEKLLKPYTRVVMQNDKLLWTESGEPIFIIHGQFYKARWREQQIRNRGGCAAGYLDDRTNPGVATAKAVDLARGAMNCLYEWFKKMLDHKITIEKKAYTNNGDPETFTE